MFLRKAVDIILYLFILIVFSFALFGCVSVKRYNQHIDAENKYHTNLEERVISLEIDELKRKLIELINESEVGIDNGD